MPRPVVVRPQAVALREPDFVQAVRHTHDTQQAGEDSAISLEEAAAQVMAKNYKSEDDRHAALEATHGSDSMNTRPGVCRLLVLSACVLCFYAIQCCFADGTSKRDRSLGGLSEKFVQIFLLGVRKGRGRGVVWLLFWLWCWFSCHVRPWFSRSASTVHVGTSGPHFVGR